MSGNTVSVLLGNGNGTFQAQQTFATGNQPDSVAVGDVNGDGKPDLVVANGQSNTVSVLLGNGNGTFQAQQTFATGTDPDSRGGWRCERRRHARPRRRQLQAATRSACCWATATAPSRPSRPSPLVSSQIRWRLAMSTATASPTSSSPMIDSNTVSVLLGNGNGTFQAQQTFAAGQ